MSVIEAGHAARRLDRILRAHENVENCAANMLAWAFQAGEELAAQKADTPHGDWLPWLAQHVPFSERVAQMYMRLFEHRDEIRANAKSVSDLGIAGALRLVREPKEKLPSQGDVLEILRAGHGEAPIDAMSRGVRVSDTPARDWTGQQTGKFTRALDKLTQATQSTEDARGLAGYGASEQLKDAAIAARQAAAILDDLAASF